MGGHPGHRGHRLVGPDQQIHLLLEADLEGITLHGGHVLAGDDRRRRETHRLAAEPRRGARDPAGEAGRLAETVGVQAVDTGEAPCPVDDRPDAHPLVLQRGDLREPPALDRHRLDAALDDAAIRVGRAAGHGDVDGQVGDLSHRRFIADGARLRREICSRIGDSRGSGAGDSGRCADWRVLVVRGAAVYSGCSSTRSGEVGMKRPRLTLSLFNPRRRLRDRLLAAMLAVALVPAGAFFVLAAVDLHGITQSTVNGAVNGLVSHQESAFQTDLGVTATTDINGSLQALQAKVVTLAGALAATTTRAAAPAPSPGAAGPPAARRPRQARPPRRARRPPARVPPPTTTRARRSATGSMRSRRPRRRAPSCWWARPAPTRGSPLELRPSRT